MYLFFGYILETDQGFDEDCDGKMTVREVLDKGIMHKKWGCFADELNLYFARKNGQRSLGKSEPECFDLYQGKLSDGLRDIMSEANKIDPDTRIETLFSTYGTYFLLEAPPRIRRKYRRSVAATRRYFIKSGQLAVEDASMS
ncbi:hypothetical protein V7S43_006557 [Phytophthora oleae]|uniref:EF-hand domain-containing protein n=1 Tax=Phytophthora oleae TaxID=2107226 RepID=A0ABD3FQ99_9STRA